MAWNIKSVSKARPCPICGHTDWCGFMPGNDGRELVLCQRALEAVPTAGIDGLTYVCVGKSKGAEAYLFMELSAKEARDAERGFNGKSVSGARANGPRTMTVIDEVIPLSHEQLDVIYRYMLSQMVLDDFHREWLRNEGWTDELIDNNMIKTMPLDDFRRFKRPSGSYYSRSPWRKAIVSACVEHFGSLRGVPGFYALNRKAADFWSLGKEKGVELMSCYAVHPEAFLSSEPLNRLYDTSNGIIKGNIAAKHIMDKRSLATIFNHTSSGFRHDNGIFAGYNLDTGHPFMWNPYDRSHNGFGVIFTGKTGTGKSATIKELAGRRVDFGAKGVIIDYDAVGTIGEYAAFTYKEGGVVYQLSSKSKNILNPYELDVEMEYDEILNKEFLTLNLLQKLAELCNILLTMIKAGKEFSDAADVIFMEEIVNEINAELYAERGIIEGNPDSLYTVGAVYEDGKLISGRVKKTMPTIHEFYVKLLEKKKNNHDKFSARAYAVLAASLKKYVRELYICEETLREFDREEYEQLKVVEGNKRVYVDLDGKEHLVSVIKGVSPYYDGQSTITVNKDTPVFDIDLSQLPKDDKPVAQAIALSYVNENIIKKNSSNPHDVQELILILDEAHNLFKFTEAVVFLAMIYRQARKRHVSPWTITQELTDFKGSKETEAIIKQSTAKFILKQDFQDRDYIAKATPLTDGQIDRLLKLGGDPNDKEASDARKGEVCLIDNDKVVFIKMVYLKSTEASFVETDVVNRQKLFEAMSRMEWGKNYG